MTPTAQHIARALVTACRITGEEPVAALTREQMREFGKLRTRVPSSRAAYIALDALDRAMPDVGKPRFARMLGFSDGTSAAERLRGQARVAKWWSEGDVLRVLDAVRAVPSVETTPVQPIDLPPLPSRKGGYIVAPANRHDRRSTVVESLGEPPPGRSALDQRRAEGRL